MPIGLNISPSIWQSYINAILDCLQNRKYCEAIMDDLLLFTSSKRSCMEKMEDLLKALLKNGLKISPKNANCLELIYSTWVIKYLYKQESMCTTPEKQAGSYAKATAPSMVKGCRSFAGMVNVLSKFCPELQKLFKPIYDLTRKGRPFI